MSLLAELKRRNVIRVALAYVVFGWLALQVSDVLVDALELPAIWNKALVAFLAIGLIPALIFSWVYELTPEGIKRESEVRREESITQVTSRKLDIVIIVLIVLSMGLFAADRFLGAPKAVSDAAPVAETSPSQGGVSVVAVLPLQALSTGDEGRFLASGLHDDLLTRLARLDAYRVISRTSVMEYANTTKNLRQIGAELGAGYIVEGGLQAIGGRVRINAQLIDASTDEHLWAQTFDRELTTANLFDVQAEIATAIAEALHTALSPRELELLEEIPTRNLEAYRAYLQGLETSGSLSAPDLHATVASLRKAVELDPEFAYAWAELSIALATRFWEEGGERDLSPDPALREESRLALEKAKALAPGSVRTLVAEAIYHYYGFRDYTAALLVLGRAEAMAPNDTQVISIRGYLLRRLGRLSEAADALLRALEGAPNLAGLERETITTLREADRCPEAGALATGALERHPQDNGILDTVAWTRLRCDRDIAAGRELVRRINITNAWELQAVIDYLAFAGNFQEAIDILTSLERPWLSQPFESRVVANYLAWLYRETGQNELAAGALDSIPETPEIQDELGASMLGQMAMTAALRGDVEGALDLGHQALASLPEDAYVRPAFRTQVIMVFTVAGALDEALAQLKIRLHERSGFETLVMLDPYLEPLRQHPGFEPLMQEARGDGPAQ